MQQLYKRLLLTLFPEEMKQADINPATMFISSLSAKEFFSLLSRKVNEYYKINGFDTGLETFEAKIGIGKEQGITIKKANDYYGYLIAAQYNGKGFFSPTFISTHVTLYSATILAPLLRHESEDLLIHTMVMIYLMPLLFVTHIKHFPQTDHPKDQYNWFVTLCLEVLRFVMEEDDEKTIQTINHVLNHESTILRNLIVICQHAAQLFPFHENAISSYRYRMLDPHIFSHDDEAIKLFLAGYDQQSTDTTITDYEEEIMTMLFPSDFSIRSLYDQVHVFDAITTIITPWYRSGDQLHELRTELSDHPTHRPDILQCFKDITYAKGHFWHGVQQFITQYRTTHTASIHEDIDEFMSSIEEGGPIDMEVVPESIRAESRVIDQIVHFYIGVVGGYRGAKNDTFWYRRTNAHRHQDWPSSRLSLETTDHEYWRHHLALYDTNGFYYQRAWEHIRKGKQKFHIPLRASLRFDTTDTYTKTSIIQSAVMGLLTMTYENRMRLTIHQSAILDVFASRYADRVRSLLADNQPIADHYWSLIDRFTGNKWSTTFGHIVGNYKLIKPLTDSLYRLDKWLRYDIIYQIVDDHELLSLLHSMYSDQTLIVLIHELSTTLFGMMLWTRYEEEENQQIPNNTMRQLYLRDVLHIDPLLCEGLQKILQYHYDRSRDLLTLRIQIDDNQNFLEMCNIMLHRFYHDQSYTITHEDILWFHSTLRHISSYNIRYIIPE